MNNSLSMDTYKSHDLSIMMKTSSGDFINLNLSNKQSLSLRSEESQNKSKSELSFSSMQSFQFSVQTNGISKQDKKEIAEFMKLAQPFLNKFTTELEDQKRSSPINEIAKKIANIFEPMRNRDEGSKNLAKNSIVTLFDETLKKRNEPLKIFNQMQALLDKTLAQFDKLTKELYA